MNLKKNYLIFVPRLLILGMALWMAGLGLQKWVITNNEFQIIGELFSRVETSEKVVALTFDDGPLEEYTPELLKVLEENNVKATFFLVGEKIEKNLHLASLILEKGHQLGNHTYEHKKMVFRSFSYVRSQIEKTNILLRDIGVDGEIFFRAPYGQKFIVLPLVLNDLGIKHILFDVEPQDWKGKPSDDVVEYVLNKTRPGSIIILHDGFKLAGSRVASSTALIIKELRKRGYRFKTVSQLLNSKP